MILFEVILTHKTGCTRGRPGSRSLFSTICGFGAGRSCRRLVQWIATGKPEQRRVLQEAEEFELLEEYSTALAQLDRAGGLRIIPPG
jgi:hypothetical protein